jgi:hypothetical protein
VESTNHVWIRPEDALAQAKRKERQMIFPQIANLQTISGFATVDDALASSRRRKIVPITPAVTGKGDERKLVLPPDSGYEIRQEALKL